jgi:hypothetical protein
MVCDKEIQIGDYFQIIGGVFHCELCEKAKKEKKEPAPKRTTLNEFFR